MGMILAGDREVKAEDIIRRALRILRMYKPGTSISGSELADNLSVLNEMLDSWSVHGLRIVARTVEPLVLTTLQSVYTIGSNATDFDTERPISILPESSYIRDASGLDYPLLPMTEEEYLSLPDKSETSGAYPSRIWFNPKYPHGEICFNSAPSAGLTLYLASEKPFSLFDDVATAFEFPPGYQAAMAWNLAVELAPEYGKPVTQLMSAKAIETLTAIENKNFKPIKAKINVPLGNSGGSMSLSDFMSGNF